jgi:hypothetical protein
MDFDMLSAFAFSRYYISYRCHAVDPFGSAVQVCLCFLVCEHTCDSRTAWQEFEKVWLSVVSHV